MLNKVAFRNAKRSINDYLLYLLTMVLISSLMFSFNSMIFSEDIMKLYSMAEIMIVMISLATFFIVIIVAWLVNYMVRFMMEKKSQEFGTYLLIGMRKQQIATLFIKENILIGFLGFILGIIPGVFLQQVFTTIFFSLFGRDYELKIEFSIESFLLTLGLYVLVYALAIWRNKRKLKKMSIQMLMNANSEHEPSSHERHSLKVIGFWMAICCFILFDVLLLSHQFTLSSFFIFLVLLIISIYLFYRAISSFIIRFVQKKKKLVYQKENLFLCRQFSAKIQSMQFTMGSITILLMFALLGSTCALMLKDALDQHLDAMVPFDLMVYSDQVGDDFDDYLAVIHDEAVVNETYRYQIYENQTDEINRHLISQFEGESINTSSSDIADYFEYDTYMKLSDYNHLREMLGYEQVSIKSNEFLIQTKSTVQSFLEGYFTHDEFCAGFVTDPFSQSGHNGADYVVVVSDEVVEGMSPYYSLMAMDLEGDAPEGLQEKLDGIRSYRNDLGNFKSRIVWGIGTDQILTYTQPAMVRSNVMIEMKFVLIAIAFPLVYIGLVFLGVALTILAVQQISDSSKFKYRYDVLSKLGLKQSEINRVIFKQLVMYYLAPLVIAILISSVISIYLSGQFIFYTGINSPIFSYFGLSLVVIVLIYMIYFVATYVQFKRNVNY